MRTRSNPKLPPPSKSREKEPKPNDKEPSIVTHRKEIEATLRELHRLQSEIYELNVPENPHSSSPVKKEIKQLSYLYENMAKPKAKNSLGIKSEDIELALRIMNKDWDADSKLQEEIIEDSNRMGMTKGNFKAEPDNSYKIGKDTLQEKFEAVTGCPINVSFISNEDESETISVKDMYAFMNYTETEDFDPVAQAYEMFLNDKGEFDLSAYNNFNSSLNLPRIKNFSTLLEAVNQASSPSHDSSSPSPTTITLEQFRKVLALEL